MSFRGKENPNSSNEQTGILIKGIRREWRANRNVDAEELLNTDFQIPSGQEICIVFDRYDGPPPLNLDWTDSVNSFKSLDAARMCYQAYKDMPNFKMFLQESPSPEILAQRRKEEEDRNRRNREYRAWRNSQGY